MKFISTIEKVLPSKQNKRGSAIALVLILGMAMMIILGSQLNRGVSNKQLNLTNSLYYEARNAAESFAEYGCADIVQRFETKTSFPANELKTNPVTTPSSASAFYEDSNIDLDQTIVKGGEIDNGYWIYLDPDDPRWEFDPLKGKRIFVRDVNLFAKATAVSEQLGGKESTAYVQQTLQVRDSPLFADAIFYNMDLELHPGPVMNILGTVHTNRDAWLQAVDKIYFHKQVSATGRLYHGNPKRPGSPHSQTGHVYFTNSENGFVSMKLGGGGSKDEDWLDSRHDDWRSMSAQFWDGNVQDESHNVPTYNPAGIADHVPDDPYTIEDELENHAYPIIEPLLPFDHADRKSDGVRNQKMAAKAGLYLRVEVDNTTETGFRIRAFKWARVNDSVPVNTQDPFDDNRTLDGNGDPILIEVQLPNPDMHPGLASEMIGAANAAMTAVDNIGEFDSEHPQPEVFESSGSDVVRGLYDHRQDMEISPVTIDISILRQVIDDRVHPSGTDLGDSFWSDEMGAVTYSPRNDWNGVVYVEFPIEADSGGTADQVVRAHPTITVVKTDSVVETITGYTADKSGEQLPKNDASSNYYPRRQQVEPGFGTHYYPLNEDGTKQTNKKGKWIYNKAETEEELATADYRNSKWPLVAQVDVQRETSTHTVGLALQIINGEFIPTPSFAENPGLTIATNAPVYLVGNYNADGIVHTDDSRIIESDHYSDFYGTDYDEPPAAIISDSFTLLSEDWYPSNGNNRRDSMDANTGGRGVGRFTEVSTAILTGLMPTVPEGSLAEPAGGAQSGGAHNFPRFLEDWNTTLTLRTSMVALFESEVHTRYMPDNHSHFYSPPTRDWGFNMNFENGIYPPGTPNLRTFRRTIFKDISKEEYTAGVSF
jgi:hypothetical protein